MLQHSKYTIIFASLLAVPAYANDISKNAKVCKVALHSEAKSRQSTPVKFRFIKARGNKLKFRAISSDTTSRVICTIKRGKVINLSWDESPQQERSIHHR
jgi:hypothetical protein